MPKKKKLKKLPVVTVFVQDGALTGWKARGVKIQLDLVDFDIEGGEGGDAVCHCDIDKDPHFHRRDI
jgi:hypothetical protein